MLNGALIFWLPCLILAVPVALVLRPFAERILSFEPDDCDERVE